ncbi:MAG: hypothetical protein SFU98_13655 [Leptospiraceae bacterium]|nr:hypothetical protein [Leptospiraceae bacterium]
MSSFEVSIFINIILLAIISTLCGFIIYQFRIRKFNSDFDRTSEKIQGISLVTNNLLDEIKSLKNKITDYELENKQLINRLMQILEEKGTLNGKVVELEKRNVLLEEKIKERKRFQSFIESKIYELDAILRIAVEHNKPFYKGYFFDEEIEYGKIRFQKMRDEIVPDIKNELKKIVD